MKGCSNKTSADAFSYETLRFSDAAELQVLLGFVPSKARAFSQGLHGLKEQ